LRQPNWLTRSRDYLLILLVGAASHWQVLFNDGTYWDDWIVRAFPSGKPYWPSILGIARETGVVITNVWLAHLYDLLDWRLVVFASVVVSGILAYRIGIETGLIGRFEALFLAFITMTFPAFQTWIVFSTASYVLCYTLFLAAALLALKAEPARGAPRWLLRGSALVLFVLSFGTNSLLVFYLGFLLLLFIVVRRREQLTTRQTLRRAPRYIYYVLLPVLFWVIKQAFFPRAGLYASYNAFTFSLEAVNNGIHVFLTDAILGQVKEALVTFLGLPALAVTVLLFFAWLLKRRAGRFAVTATQPSKLVVFGLVLLFLAIFPYVAVGLRPTLHGWETRHALLVALPLGLVTVGVTRLSIGPNPDAGTGANVTATILLSCLVAAFCLATNGNYAKWQARWAKDRSVIEKLRTMNDLRPVSVFWVNDFSRIGTAEGYQFYEWSHLLNSIWSGESRIGLDQRLNTYVYWSSRLMNLRKFFSERYALSGFDPTGSQVFLSIRRGPRMTGAGDAEIAGRYLLYSRILPGRLPGFLAELTDVQAQPVEAVKE
jgi:hypothetical protein